MLYVKICGITREIDAALAVELGADAIGFIFFDKSPRNIPVERAESISDSLPEHVARVGVFVDPQIQWALTIMERASLDMMQLHGQEALHIAAQIDSHPVIVSQQIGPAGEALPAKFPASVAAILLDTWHPTLAGGTGRTFDWDLLKRIQTDRHLILAGGLTPENIYSAVKQVGPYAVDVSSGVELAPGMKCKYKLTEFFNQVEDFRHDRQQDGKKHFLRAQ